MSYGIVPYGKQSYGGTTANLTIVGARAVSTNVIRVTLSKEPQNLSAQFVGDVLNPRTWQVFRNDTGVGFTVLNVTEHDDPSVWDVRVLESLGSVNVEHTVSAFDLLDKNGSPIDTPRTATFNGLTSVVKSSKEAEAAARGFAVRDINNPQPANSEGGEGGTFIIGKDGDYQLHEGTDFVTKQIFRRLMTVRGGFRFLPNFGLGLRVKEPVPAGDLITLQKEITDQVKQEPEVDVVRAIVTQDQNKLTVVVQAKLKATGQQVSVPFEVPFGVRL